MQSLCSTTSPSSQNEVSLSVSVHGSPSQRPPIEHNRHRTTTSFILTEAVERLLDYVCTITFVLCATPMLNDNLEYGSVIRAKLNKIAFTVCRGF